MSLVASALRIAASSCASSSAMAPRNIASPPFSLIAARDDRAIGVVDRGRAQRLARLHQLVAGGDHGDARPARDGNLRDPAGRAHADLARADHGAGAQQRLAARDVGTGIGHELPGRGGAADLDRATADRLGMLDHDDGVGAARQRAAGRNRRRGSRQLPACVGAVPQAMTSSFSLSRTGLASPAEARSAERTAKPSTLERSNGGTSIGATTSCASATAERIRQRPRFARQRRAETARPRTAPAPPRATGWSGTGPDPCCHGFSATGALVMSEPINPISVPQHIGIDRRARSIALGPARHRQPCVGAGDRLEREVADRQRQPAALALVAAARFRRCPTLEAILRASGSVTGCRGERAGQDDPAPATPASTMPPSAWSGAPGSAITGMFRSCPQPRSGRAAARCHGR